MSCEVKGFRLYDKILHLSCRFSGNFDIRALGGSLISAEVSYKKLRLLENAEYICLSSQATKHTRSGDISSIQMQEGSVEIIYESNG